MLFEELREELKKIQGKISTCYSEFPFLHLGAKEGKYLLITPPDFELHLELAALFGKKAILFPPPRDKIFSSLPLSPYSLARRVKTLWLASRGLADIIVAPVNSLLPLPSPSWVQKHVFSLHKDEEFEVELLIEYFRELEYTERDFVKQIGEYSIRGGIVDYFSGWDEFPTRLEFSGDEIISIRSFDPSSQLSLEEKREAIIGPFREYSLKKAPQKLNEIKNKVPREKTFAIERILEQLSESEPGEVFVLLKNGLLPAIDFFSDFTPIFFNYKKIQEYLREEKRAEEESFVPYPALEDLIKLPESTIIEYCKSEGKAVNFYPIEPLKGSFSAWEKWLESEKQASKKVLAVWDREEKPYFADEVVRGNLKKGFQFRDWIVLGSENIIGREEAPKKIKRLRAKAFKLEENQYVVHEDYGIGIFRGLVRYTEELEGDFLVVEYAAGEKLYVPVEASYKLHPYEVPEGYQVRIDRLSSPRWARLKEKVKRQVQKIVETMVELYAERKAKKGHSFSYDRMLEEFIADFEYEETEDQKRAWEEVREDMEREYPMDRLLVGDVGFGKTEIAMRAAFLAVLNGKQVAVLAPTTVLALQHYNNFRKRFKNYAVEIALLSRLTPKSQEPKIIEALKKGKIDIVIGTHRLLSEDVGFKDLGLLIIDEEQRFGVRHKEKLRELKKDVDSLTMTATPIPRTLSLALFSVWDLSIIQTPPPGRKEVETFVLPYREEVFKEAIERELKRDGQVYIVLNKIEELSHHKKKLEELFPGIPILMLHGRMRPSVIEKGIIEFMEGKYPILLTTTIIENGIDIPNVNTLIVLRAENMGLAQLHQLRGRVGRSYRKAYAYFFMHIKQLSDKAERRLRAIREFSSLGAGFQLSLEDMNIRGAGTLLGTAQHGHIAELGMDYYLKILQETISKIKGERKGVELKLGLDIRIPEFYMPDPEERVNYYRLITSVESEEELERIKEEIHDKYAKPPEGMEDVYTLGKIVALSGRLGIQRLERRGEEIFIAFHNTPDPALIYKFVERQRGRFEPDGIILPIYPNVRSIEKILQELNKILN